MNGETLGEGSDKVRGRYKVRERQGEGRHWVRRRDKVRGETR